MPSYELINGDSLTVLKNEIGDNTVDLNLTCLHEADRRITEAKNMREPGF